MSNADVMAPPSWSAVWPLLARGGLSLAFGLTALLLLVLAVVMPGIVAALLLVVFAGFVLVDACLGLGLLLFAHGSRDDRVGLAARSAVGLGIALAAFTGPITAGRPWDRLATLVAVWVVLNGLIDIAAGFGLYGRARRRWQAVIGVVSLGLGVVLIAWPPGMIGLTWWIGSFSAVYGVVIFIEACRFVRFN